MLLKQSSKCFQKKDACEMQTSINILFKLLNLTGNLRIILRLMCANGEKRASYVSNHQVSLFGIFTF